jgi:RNA polymerase sigma-70 factor (ECF subfamily)
MDRELVIAAQHGDEDAFSALVLGVGDRLYATAYRILRDRSIAEDVVQQAMLDVWQHLPSLRNPDRFVSWTFQVLVRACYRVGRTELSNARLRVLTLEQTAAVDEIDLVADRDQLLRAFGRLSIEHRTVIVLRHYSDWPLTEIAEALGIPLGTARSRLHYALRSMRAALEADERRTKRREARR